MLWASPGNAEFSTSFGKIIIWQEHQTIFENEDQFGLEIFYPLRFRGFCREEFKTVKLLSNLKKHLLKKYFYSIN